MTDIVAALRRAVEGTYYLTPSEIRLLRGAAEWIEHHPDREAMELAIESATLLLEHEGRHRTASP